MNLNEYLTTRKRLIHAELDRRLPPESEPPERLHQALRYSVLNGGKRIRPILALAAAEAVGGDPGNALPAACAVELIHAFSLIHDDLPCMDDDDLRRGKPTSHKVFGESTALLAGDALLALAFEILAQTPPSVPAAAALEAMRVVARAAGTMGMAGGQALDLEAEGRDVTLREVERIHRRKTGALIEAAVVAGGVIGGADEAQKKALGEYGRQAGLAFQIVDDLLDVLGNEEKMGKAVGSDLKHDKATYPGVVGAQESRRIAQDACSRAVEALSSFGESADPLRALARLVVEREA